MKLFRTTLILTLLTSTILSEDILPNQKDLRVFENALKTMLEIDTSDSPFRGMHREGIVKGTYMKHQGLLIEIETRFASKAMMFSSDFQFDMPDFDFHFEVPEAPLAPGFDEERGDNVYQAIEEVQLRRMERELESAQKERSFLEKEREFLEQDLQKELKDAQKAREENRARLKAELKALKENIKNVDKGKLQEELKKQQEDQMAALKKYQEELKKIKAQHQINWAEESKKIETAVLETLCQYGSSIRNVKDDEFFTIILRGFEPDESGHRLDRIYVLPRRLVIACRDGEISQQELLKQSETYTSN